jgi:hypothetical protein
MRAPPRAADHAEKFCDRVARRGIAYAQRNDAREE